ncbi:hypothetical protein Shal_1899 [Shewanella halifaxensis HAW-EB4]|uniref:Uncharacterized protein n=2 Tax=Shewanella halifaxensis TaxID=271098 RepID=B0TRP6_SHEHH|nr:hypothetical protein Shal_1899 [Shewanella halifaxensis HAW-EB4]
MAMLEQNVEVDISFTADKKEGPDLSLTFASLDCHSKLEVNLLSESCLLSEMSQVADYNNGHRHKTGFNTLLVITSVFLLHLIAIIVINHLWTRAIPIAKKVVAPKIQSYLYQIPKNASEQVMQVGGHVDNHVDSQAKVEQTVNQQENKETAAIVQPETKWVPVNANQANEQVKSAVMAPLVSSPTQSLNQRIGQKTSRPSQFTQSYLAKQRANKLDDLVIDSANQYTRKRSLSEMDADMQELVFLEVDKYSKVSITDHRLDPNRIVRLGDTCYRIVKVPTQINPYAENLGYPFNCGGDKIKKAINDAISARLEKRMVSKNR